jgi:O-methyltransferase
LLRQFESMRSALNGRSSSALRQSLGRVRDDAYRLALSSTARRVSRRRLTYLSARKLHNLERCARALNRRGVPGDFLECGVALGGSAIVLASHLTAARRLHGYDVFGLIPPPSERDDEWAHRRYETIRSGRSSGIGGDPYYGYADNLFDVAVGNFRAFGFEPDGRSVVLHQGLFENTMRFADGQRVALAHIDCDWHDPVSFCLEAIYRHLSPGGAIILDDYNDYGGCRLATLEFLAQHDDIEVRSASSNAVLYRRDAEG